MSVRAGRFDIGQIHVGAHMHTQRVRDAVHHFAHTEAAGARPQIQHADAHNHTGFRRDSSLGDRLVPVTLDILHVEWNGMRMVFPHRSRGIFDAACLRVVPQSGSLMFLL